MEMSGLASTARSSPLPVVAVTAPVALSRPFSFRSSSFFGCNTPPLRPLASRVALSPIASLSSSHHQEEALSHGSKFAFISLYDKKDLMLIGKGLHELGYTLVSTGETASALEDAGLAVTEVDYRGGWFFDVVVMNLRPFCEATFYDDITLFSMLRYAALSFNNMLVVVDAEDYPEVLEFLKSHRDDLSFRMKLALKAMQNVVLRKQLD